MKAKNMILGLYRSMRNHFFIINLLIVISATLFFQSINCDIHLGGIADMLQNFEAIDPEVLNVFAFRNKPSYRRVDPEELDLTEMDTSDMLNCFATLSYSCFQKKLIVYVDSLNRVNKINLFGGYMSFVRLTPGLSAPPITEQMLASRNINNDDQSLGSLLRQLFDEFVDSHILRITVPVLNAKVEAKSARGYCYDFVLGGDEDAAVAATQPTTKMTLEKSSTKLAVSNNETSEEASSIEKSRAESRSSTCYRSDQSMVAISSAIMMKMMMVLPALLKLIAAKAIFGLLMGVVSVVLSKMTLLPLIMSYTKSPLAHVAHNNNHETVGAIPITGTYRYGPYPITTDNYGSYFPVQGDSPAKDISIKMTTSVPSILNVIGPTSSQYDIPTGPVLDNTWSGSKIINNYNNAAPMKRYSTKETLTSGSKAKGVVYPYLNGRSTHADFYTDDNAFKPILTTAPINVVTDNTLIRNHINDQFLKETE